LQFWWNLRLMHRYPALILVVLLALSGVAQARGTARIVGGTAAPQGAWPSTVFLEAATDLNGDGTFDEASLCTGSLIAPSWVVTAGHCAFSIAQPTRRVTAMSAVLGVSDLTDPAGQLIGVDHIVVNPGFSDAVSPRDDIALAHLAVPASQPPIALPVAGGQYAMPANVANAAGWGTTDVNSTVTTSVLQQAWLPIQDQNAVCSPIVNGALAGSYDPATMLCAGNPHTSGACHGDSGGPLVVFDQSTGAPVLWGLTSFGISASPPCSLSVPVVFTSVSAFLTFIHATINPPPPAAPTTTTPTTTTTPAPPTQPTTPMVVPSPDRTPPQLASLALSRTRVRTSATLSFRLSEAAVVTITVQRGHTVRRHTTWTSLRPSLIAKGKVGANRVTFKPRVAGRVLAAGAYRVSVQAADVAGNRSAAKTVAFTVVKN
jgi:secreted trypsin-like serine protease